MTASDEPAATRERLTRERVVAAALAIVDRDGLEKFTMRALGRELGVDPMAAYHWFPNKVSIAQGVVEAILAEIPVPDASTTMPWPEALRLIAREYRRAIIGHPNALPVVSTQPPLTPRGLRLIEDAASLLVRGGLAPVDALEAINGGAALVIGTALVEVGVTPGTEAIEQEEILKVFSSLSPEEFPTITSVLATTDPAAFDPERQFEDLLDAFVRGLAARLEEQHPKAR